MTTPPAPADWGTRVAATLLDLAVSFALTAVVLLLSFVLGRASGALGLLALVLGYLAVFGFGVWQLVVQGQTGQTIGKKQLGIRLVREQDGQVVGAGLSVGRAFVHVVDAAACGVGYLWPLWDAKRQTFADKLLTTLVVRA